uniref:Uncharacterized protein n=1 Tax=viral metagenome TaxID=1070528 RepID=A0A6C0JS52_9ZZZZ
MFTSTNERPFRVITNSGFRECTENAVYSTEPSKIDLAVLEILSNESGYIEEGYGIFCSSFAGEQSIP